jgi:hypothetical protein
MSESKYRSDLPQLREEKLFLVDGGLETHLVYHQGKYFYEHLSQVRINYLLDHNKRLY